MKINENTAIMIWFLTSPVKQRHFLLYFFASINMCDRRCTIICMQIMLFHTQVLSHWGRDKIAAISQTTFSKAFSSKKFFEFRLKFDWNLFPWVQLKISQHWFRKWLGAVQTISHYLNLYWHSSPTHICVTRPQWVEKKTEVYTCRIEWRP